MRKTIKNIDDLAKALESKITATLELVSEDVKKEIDVALKECRNEYNPIYYRRTKQILDCCKIGQVKKNGNKLSVEICLDVDSLKYMANGADPYKTLVAANSSLRGAIDPSNPHGGQIPWDHISSNDGSRHGNGTQIWGEPMQELFDNGKLIESFKRHAKARGLNIK